MLDEIKIIDAHMHHVGRFKSRNEPLLDYMDKYDIDKAIITTLNQSANINLLMESGGNINQSKIFEQLNAENQLDHTEVKELVDNNKERLIGFYWFNPKKASERDWKILEDYLKNSNFKGVKTHACVDNLRIPNDFEYLAEFLIDRNLPIYFHSSSGFFYQDPIRAKDLYKFLKNYKDLKVIIGHAAFTMEYCINLLRYFRDSSNIFFETSLSVPYGIGLLIMTMGSERVIFGSDSPTATTPDIEINKFKILNLKKPILENVFYNNITNLLGEN